MSKEYEDKVRQKAGVLIKELVRDYIGDHDDLDRLSPAEIRERLDVFFTAINYLLESYFEINERLDGLPDDIKEKVKEWN